MNTYEWNFDPIIVKAEPENEMEDIISVVHWRITAISDDNFTESLIGSMNCGEPNPENFVAFDEVTKDMVKDWVFEAAGGGQGEEKIHAALDEKIERLRNPPVVSKRPAGW